MDSKKIINRQNILAFIGIIGVLYTLFPYLYSIFYAVPASDDFAMTLGREGFQNIFEEFFEDIFFFWNQRGGSVFYFASQLLFNPLNFRFHLGHTYGLYMIFIFLILNIMISIGVFEIFNFMLGGENKRLSFAAMIVLMMVFLQNNYYVETYNWYVGMNAYAIPLAFLLLTIWGWLRYSITNKRKYYVWSVIMGVIVANSFLFDVTLGICFVFLILYKDIFNKDSLLVKIMPLVLYVVMGIVTVLAPGNFARQQIYGESFSIVSALKNTAICVVYFNYNYIRYKALSIIAIIIMIILGAIAYKKNSIRMKLVDIIICGASFIIAEYGFLLPYIYGRGMTERYLDVRVQYVLDFIILITWCIIAFKVSALCCGIMSKLVDFKVVICSTITILMVAVTYFFISGNVLRITSIDIIPKAHDISKSYQLWNGILKEIKESPDSDVVVDRDYNILWNKYFLYSGMEPGEVYAQPLQTFYSGEQILPNVYYKKNSVIINYPK